jgi:predicted aspartyl protease
LIYKRKPVAPAQEFRGQGYPTDFGSFSRFEIPIKFQGNEGWSDFSYDFVFDTGAYISYAPQSILDALEIEPIFEGFVHGILQEHKVQVKVAEISIRLVDDRDNESSPIKCWFAFYQGDSGPRLLGMKSLLKEIGFSKPLHQDELILTVEDA